MNKIIEDYVLLEKIGQGQYGNVYKAENRKNKLTYAVKVMNVEKFKHTPKLSEFTNNEIAILSKINHINIIKFVQMLRTANNYYLVYEYCNGGTLAELIKSKGRLTEAETMKIFLQLRSAFQTLYAENILHRDLKPTNILFHNGVIKLADFGFCKELLKQSDMTQTMVGSPIYMAPEVLKGLIYDIRADIWSLGVILYQMLYGVCPYQESTIPKLVSLIDNTILRFPPDIVVSEHLKILMKRMLTIKYRERITPQQFIKFQLEVGKDTKPDYSIPSSSSLTFKDVAKFIRRSVAYLAQTLDFLTDYVDDSSYLKLSFLIYKILSAVQKDTCRQSQYWQFLKVINNEDKWDSAYQTEINLIRPYGQTIKEAISKTDNSLKIKMELQTNYIDAKFFMELAKTIKDSQIKDRLLNCLLISRHFMTILQKKSPDFIDYPTSKKSAQQKEQICLKYAKCF